MNYKVLSKTHFLFGGKAYYQITFDINGQIVGLKNVTKHTSKIDEILFSSLNPECIGYIEEVKNQNLLNLLNFEGIRCEIKYDDEKIIYAKFKNTLYFFYIVSGEHAHIDIDNIEDQISCKLVESAKYVCSYTFKNKVHIT